MSKKFVDIEALNFRSAPVVTPSNRIGLLHLGQPVEELGPDAKDGWVKIRAEVGGGVVKEGVVKEEIDDRPSLREPVSAARDALVAEAIKEWLRFEKGQGEEFEDPFFKFVGEMWEAIHLHLTGKDRGVPWSAAAISFMVRNAGATFPKYKNFKFAPSHSTYFHDSIVKQQSSDAAAPFWGFRRFEKSPQIGDIVGVWRETESTFEDAKRGDSFPSHSDIIVSVGPDFVLAIGGNVRQSVNITRYEKTQSGFLVKEDRVIILMVNQA
jgi:Uncharacterized protein conserved in bacteria (DUF2272)